jgi:chemotaxis regulatin CheY-phosphate phosphatase CheZ
MGFIPEPTIYTLSFDEDTGLAGLHVRVKCCTFGEFNQMLRGSQDPIMDADVPEDTTDAVAMKELLSKVRDYSRVAADANEEAMAMFLKYLVEWDLADPVTGEIVPRTLEGIRSVEKPVIAAIIASWHLAMMAVPVPLKQASMNGRRSEEATLDLGSLSENLPNWPTPS